MITGIVGEVAKNSLDPRQRAHHKVNEILSLPPSSHIDAAADQLIREMFPIHLDRT